MVQVDYSTYLKTDKWRDKSHARMEYDNFCCYACKKSYEYGVTTLNVHHLTYRNVGNEPLSDLVTLCENCHKNFHLIKKLEEECEARYLEEDRKKAERERAVSYQNNQLSWKAEHERLIRLKKQATKEIEEEHLDDDYSRGGAIDMCNWAVIEKFCEEKKTEYESKYGIVLFLGKQDIRDFFHCRRLEFIARCINKGLSPELVARRSMLTLPFIQKWYDIGKINKRLEQEKLIGG